MSTDSLRKQSKQGYHGQIILPQPINDPSLIESVAGFIHEVVPQAYSSVLPGETRDGILWAKFDSTDLNDPENFPQLSECESESTSPLLLILGYSTGVQVWSVGGSGEATELLSWCQGAVRALRFLLKPLSRDPHSSKRPLVAIIDSSSPGPQFSTLSFVSLKTADVVKIIKFNSPICDVHCNRKSIVVTFSERIAVFDAATLEDRLTITTCYLSPGNSPNPIALGARWLAYGEKRLTTWQRSSGGCEGDGAQSYTSAVIHAAKSLGKGLRELGGSLTGSTQQTLHNAQAQPGIVSIIDIERKCSTNTEDRGNMIAHFVAHTSAVVAMTFDPSGLLLITADRHGHRFNVFRIHPHPCTSQLAAVHHLYVLHRGETTARVQDITISWDSRWVAVSSVRGTTHVFPITPYGGLVTVRTHATPNVVNKLSRFERSAGLRDGRGSPLPCEAPPTPPPPRLPPYPHPSIAIPLAQLRARPDDAPLAASFGPPRAWIPGRPKSKRTCADSLYIIYSSGAFMQYDLDPKVIQGVPKEKISFDTSIELGIEAKAEWILPKPPYTSSLCPPLPLGHVLLDLPSRSHPPPDKWLSQVEIVSHTGPHRRLWMGPQFTFKSIDPLPLSGGEGDSGPEGGNPLRSNPVNMPHRPYLLVEIGSGSPQMAEVDEAGGRLREDLADAMLETQHASGQAKGKLRRAEVEWQVNPLGAVQTHPTSHHSPWPHPIFFEPYPEEHYRGVQQVQPQKTVEAALERIKLQEQLAVSSPQDKIDLSGNIPSCQEEKMSVTTDISIPSEDFHTGGNTQNFSDFPNIRNVLDDLNPIVELEPLETEPISLIETAIPPLQLLSDKNLLLDLNIPPVNIEYSEDASTKDNVFVVEQTSTNKDETRENIDESLSKQQGTEENIDESLSKQQETEESVDDSLPKMQEIEEKVSKPSGKKGVKKRKGNAKKIKKDQAKPEEIAILDISDTSSKNDTFKLESDIQQYSTIKEIIEHKIETTLDQDILLTVGNKQSVLACGVIEVTEEISLIEDNKISPVTDECLEPPREIQISEDTTLASSNEPLEYTTEENIKISDDETPIIVKDEEIVHQEVHDFLPVDKPPNIVNDGDGVPVEEVLEVEDIKDLNGNNMQASVDSSQSLDTSVDTSKDTTSVDTSKDTTSVDASKDTTSVDASKDTTSFDASKDTTSVDASKDKTSVDASKDTTSVDASKDTTSVDASKDTSVDASKYTTDKSEEEMQCSTSIEVEQVYESQAVDENIEQEGNEFIMVPSKPNRNKNRRKKKEKKLEEVSQTTETSETESSFSNLIIKNEVLFELEQMVHSSVADTEVENISSLPLDDSPLKFDVEETVDRKEDTLEVEIQEEIYPSQADSNIVDSISATNIDSSSPILSSDNLPSDQLTSTEKSELEDVSSHSGKESDDSKISKKERSRRHKRSESSDKDHSDIKKKSPSPIKSKSDVKKDSESSDEAILKVEIKQCTPKIQKRKKGKKSGEEGISEMPIMEIGYSPTSTDAEESNRIMPKEKSSESSLESSLESRPPKQAITRTWSQSANSSDHPNLIEDRDSIYESCNDDGASDSLAFESSKEDFDESSSKVTPTEPSSSNAEEKNDASDKTNQPSKKQLRKQKKKKR